ncbi:Flap endonuclease Xni [Pseudoalteromonas holothuriae]|uniref:Flap endonuclease Xni n=1 Tax=Pseudoalteromonas holothuriae TaxID=2963714 RepID=A0A9W4R428_9GAMM|nr:MULTISPECIES: flap endonuclease Xni [unclassified Pseudoalteromonas]CAH9065201.1 Flap endonuclease Xni [Pseudoalteromonas sp. CIP111854]CAH9066556.1 Flap endonuclease Xni [Pseudoalteromonas sp. CIP111951]
MKAKIVLIDALNLIRRIYAVDEQQNHRSAQQTLISCKSRVSHATKKLLSLTDASHAIAVFDGQKSWRYHFYAKYKHSRKPMPEQLANNLEFISQAFVEQGITVYKPEQDEADDVIATLACKASDAAVQSVIVSTDKGFYPLLSNNITIYDYFKRDWLTDNYIIERFGVNKHQLIDFWALAGDKTNDIPGVAGIGQKSACQLINGYRDIAVAIDDPNCKPAIKKKLTIGMDDYVISKQLVTLRKDIHLGFNMKQLRLNQHDMV